MGAFQHVVRKRSPLLSPNSSKAVLQEQLQNSGLKEQLTEQQLIDHLERQKQVNQKAKESLQKRFDQMSLKYQKKIDKLVKI